MQLQSGQIHHRNTRTHSHSPWGCCCTRAPGRPSALNDSTSQTHTPRCACCVHHCQPATQQLLYPSHVTLAQLLLPPPRRACISRRATATGPPSSAMRCDCCWLPLPSQLPGRNFCTKLGGSISKCTSTHISSPPSVSRATTRTSYSPWCDKQWKTQEDTESRQPATIVQRRTQQETLPSSPRVVLLTHIPTLHFVVPLLLLALLRSTPPTPTPPLHATASLPPYFHPFPHYSLRTGGAMGGRS